MNEIRAARRRAQRYRFSDGIGEFVTGSVLALIGTGFLIADFLDSDTLRIVSLGVAFALALLGFLTVRFLKERITYPRTGYVRPPKPQLTYPQRFGLNVLFLLIVMPPIHEYFGPALDVDTATGRVAFLGWVTVMVAPIAVMAVRFGVYRLLFVVGTALATGGAAILLRIPGGEMIGSLFTFTGAAAVITGTCALYGYLRAHPRSALDGDHEV